MCILLYYVFVFDSRQAFFRLKLKVLAFLLSLLSLYRFLDLAGLSWLQGIFLLHDFHGMVKVNSQRLLNKAHYLKKGELARVVD